MSAKIDKKRVHWSFDDPAEATGSEEERISAFRRVRDEIAENVRAFVRASPSANLESKKDASTPR